MTSYIILVILHLVQNSVNLFCVLYGDLFLCPAASLSLRTMASRTLHQIRPKANNLFANLSLTEDQYLHPNIGAQKVFTTKILDCKIYTRQLIEFFLDRFICTNVFLHWRLTGPTPRVVCWTGMLVVSQPGVGENTPKAPFQRRSAKLIKSVCARNQLNLKILQVHARLN